MNARKIPISVKDMAFTALFTAVMCAIAPLSITIGPIPLSLATLVIYLAAGTLGWKYGTVSVALYVALGAIGLPVFSNFEGGFYKIAGVTGGFIVGYIPLALASGLPGIISPRRLWFDILGMVIGTILLYTCGVAWFMIHMNTPLAAAIAACVTPFLIGDTIKIIVASVVTPQLRKALPRT